MKFTDPVSKREALIDGVLKPAEGEPDADANGWQSPRRWVYVDKEGVPWFIAGSAEGTSTTLNHWEGLMADMVASPYYKNDRGVEPLAIVSKRTLLDLVEAIDAYGYAWRSAARKEAKDGGDSGAGVLFLVLLALAALSKGKR